MNLFRIRIEETRQRNLEILAPTVEAARKRIAAEARRADRKVKILGTAETHVQPQPGRGREVLETLFTADFLPLDGTPANLTDWIDHLLDALAAPRGGARAQLLGKGLSHAGIRVMSVGAADKATLTVVTTTSHPFLANVLGTAPWGPSLMALPDARRTCGTFAGFRGRAVMLPAPSWLPVFKGEAALAEADA